MTNTLPIGRLSPSHAFESEIPLIVKDAADRVREEIEDMGRVLEYDLRPKPPRSIHDTYYDTEENSLRNRKITLRTRRVSGSLLISSKSDIRKISGNVIRRKEVELPWSYDSVRLLAKNLKLRTHPPSISEFQRIPASRTLAAMGLEVVQERETRRNARNIFRRGARSTSILAELAVDRVTYTFKRTKVGLSEVEIEAKAPGGLPSVREIANELLSRHRPYLEEWPYGKFVTGLAIMKRLKSKGFRPFLMGGRLKPGAFQLIERTIRSGIF